MDDESSGSGWWTGWLQTAKEKSASAVEFLRTDLAEFTCTVQQDTSNAVQNIKGKINSENAVTATEKVKAGVSTLWGGLSKALIVEAEDKDDPGIPIQVFSRAKARLHAIQMDPATYCEEPSGTREDYEAWLEDFRLDSKKGDISELLVANAQVRSFYTQMVPSSIAHADFWQRYFYKVHQLQQEEARKEALKKRADESQEQVELVWDDEDDWCDIGGPASPPKPAAGHMESAMALARQTRQDVAAEAAEELTQEPAGETQGSQETPDEGSLARSAEKGRLKGTPSEPVKICDKPISEPIDDAVPVIAEPVEGSPSSSAGREVAESHHSSKDSSLSSGMVVVSSVRTTPSPDSTTTKESSGLDDEWEQEFDLEVTEEDIRMAEEAASKIEVEAEEGTENDWENWD